MDAPGYTLHPGVFVSGPDDVDQVVVGVFRAPRSYTGEDTVEVSGHGSPVVMERIVRDLVNAGCRLAEPGEFTRRAYLNGKLDLAQADSVAALIAARSEAASRVAIRQLEGTLSARVTTARDELVTALALLEATIDFPEQDLEPVDLSAVRRHLDTGLHDVRALIDASERGRAVAEQVTVALVGVPNVGKSSLFNALLRRDRAIVHPAPGTTRDLVDAEFILDGVAIRLVDTAGLTTSDDRVEAEGVRRSRRIVDEADLVLFVLDATRADLNGEERELLETLDLRRVVAVFNKVDLVSDVAGLPATLAADTEHPLDTVPVSATAGTGLAALESAIRVVSGRDVADNADVVIAGEWQRERMLAASRALSDASRLLDADDPPLELVAEEFRTSINGLGALLGLRVGEELLDVIFGAFCIGK
jgi:tRNA modification GTPase